MEYTKAWTGVMVGLFFGAACDPLGAAVLAVTYGGDVLQIDELTGDVTELGHSGFDELNALTRDAAGQYFASTADGSIVQIDPVSGSGDLVLSIPMPTPVDIVRALAVSADGELYWATGSLFELSADTLQKYDPDTGTISSIDIVRTDTTGVMVPTLTGFAFAPDGMLMGWDQQIYGLVMIDPETAIATEVGGHMGPPAANIESIAFDLDGNLRGVGGYSRSGQDNYFEIDARGEALSYLRLGPYDIRGIAFMHGDEGGGEEEPPEPGEPPRLRRPEPPQPEIVHNLYLVDCGPCPQCFERPCDPRVNPEADRFLVWDPYRDVAVSFSRKDLGLAAEDGPITAAAPLTGWGTEREVFVIALPYSGARGPATGSVLFFDLNGEAVGRMDGQHSGEYFGVSIDAWDDEVVVASTERWVRLRQGEAVRTQKLDAAWSAQRGVQVAFTRDLDGDKRPEVMLGAPYAPAGALGEAGTILVFSSQTGAVLDQQSGRVAGQHLGRTLQPIRPPPSKP